MNQKLISILDDFPGLEGVLKSLDDAWPIDSGKVVRGGDIIKEILGRISRGSPANSPFNVFPGGVPGDCHNLLLVGIGTPDVELEKALDQALRHVGIRCPGTTRTVIFYAMWWSGKQWAARRSEFQKLGIVCGLMMPFHDGVRLR